MHFPSINTMLGRLFAQSESVAISEVLLAIGITSYLLVQTFGHVNMKIAILFLCALCVVSYKRADAQNTGIMGYSCLEKQGISTNELPKLLSDESEEGRRKRGCVEVCYFEKIGLMKDNQISLDVINNLFNTVMPPGEKTESMRQNINECAANATSAGGNDPCIMADMFTQCGLEEFKINIRSLFRQMAA